MSGRSRGHEHEVEGVSASEALEALRAEVSGLRADMERLEGKIDALFALRQREGSGIGFSPMHRAEAHRLLGALTTKQHCVAQMMVLGIVDRVMGERMGVSRNTAKLHRNAITHKLGVRNSKEAIHRLTELLEAVDPREYTRLSGGLPRNWAHTWASPDPYAYLYAVGKSP